MWSFIGSQSYSGNSATTRLVKVIKPIPHSCIASMNFPLPTLYYVGVG